jgi:O6-methylguanine-DNA--protein-cysteine methyltransferase
MPDYTVSLSAAQDRRLKDALGREGVPATTQQVTQWIRRQVYGQVVQYEDRAEHVLADTKVRTRLQQEGWNG